MNQLFKEYPKPVEIKCYHPVGQWNVRATPNAELCKICTHFKAFFDEQYRDLAANPVVHTSSIVIIE